MSVKTIVAGALAAVALLASQANSHMIMNLPKPYNYNTDPYVEVNPLDGSSFKFPCQGRGYTVDSDITTVVAGGAPLPVTFAGTAAHGGGSCQFSVSYDDPQAAGGWNASFKFKTIYTLIGGCPASSVANLQYAGGGSHGRADGPHCGNDFGKECIREFSIPFPKFLKNGPAVFSWTWHNRLGNREIYQNCAPILITGGTDDAAQIDALPDIFLGNLPAVQTDVPGYKPCHLAQGQTVNYPNPGNYGRVLEPPTDPEGMPSDYCSDVPPASVLPKFEGGDHGTDGAQVTPITNVSNTPATAAGSSLAIAGSVFLTIPTDGGVRAGGYGPHPTTEESPLTATSTSTSYGHTVTITLPSNTTITICPGPAVPETFTSSSSQSQQYTTTTGTTFPTLDPGYGHGYSYSGFGGSGAGGSGFSTVAEVQETTYTIVETKHEPSVTITLQPVDSAPVNPTWLQPCGSTTPSETDLGACWH